VQIGDTQGANETQLQSIVNLVVGNKTALGIQYVVHIGDIVEVYYNETDWEIKNAAFSQFTDVIPFGWLAGNHDGESKNYIGDNYYAFNASNYPNMTSSYDQGRSTAQYFNFSGTQILFVNLEYFANKTALQWWENLYQYYDKATVVFSTHSYLDLTGNYTNDTINSTYLDAYPRVKLVLCGHLPYALNQQVNGRNEIRFDYQLVPDYVPDLSDFVRIYTVFDDGTLDARTYSQLRDQFLKDSANQFSFNLFTPQTTTPLPTATPPATPIPTETPTPSLNSAPPNLPTSSTPTSAPTVSHITSPSPTPTIQEFPLVIIALAALLVVSAAMLFSFRKSKNIRMISRAKL
jgi:hypothetical protein